MSGRTEPRRVCLGAFAGAHGVNGDAKIKTFTEKPENIAAYGPVETEDGKRTFTFNIAKVLKGGLVIVRAPEIASREDAESLKGVRLYVDRNALPEPDEDEFYLDDLVGLTALGETGAPMGFVKAVYNFGAGDVIELSDIPGVKGVKLIPFTRRAVPGVDIEGGKILVSAGALENASGGANPIISDETGEIVSDDLDVLLAAMREEDA